MPESNDCDLARIEQTVAERYGDFDLPDDLLSSSENDEDETPVAATDLRAATSTEADARFPHMRKHTLTGTVKAHTQIYVVNEQIVHGKSTWSSSLCAFDSLHSANTDARNRAIFQHAKGDASLVQAHYQNGHGAWTTVLETERGRITKSVFVNATVLQYLAAPPVTPYEERPAPGDRLVPSQVPGSTRVRRIQAFRSTDSIRGETAPSSPARREFQPEQGRLPGPFQREDLARRRDRLVADAIVSEGDGKGVGNETAMQSSNGVTISKQRSVGDLREFASLHTLL